MKHPVIGKLVSISRRYGGCAESAHSLAEYLI